jgi:hypothetical protein
VFFEFLALDWNFLGCDCPTQALKIEELDVKKMFSNNKNGKNCL